MNDEGFSIGDSGPLKALREGLVNMLMHADYFSPAKSRIRIFSDRIEFFNPGSLPVPLEELLETDISLPRNPVLAKLFRAVRLAENAGFGFDKMIDGWKEYNNKVKPEFDSGIEYSIITFYYLSDDLPENKAVSEKWSEKWSEKLTNRQIEILWYIQANDRISRKELSEKIGINQSAIQQHISKLKNMHILKRIGPDKGGHWEILK